MKKIITLICFSFLCFTSCVEDDEVDLDTIGITYELDNVNFEIANGDTITFTFPTELFSSDKVLVFRFLGTQFGKDVWEPLPSIFFLENNLIINYRFDFSSTRVNIFLESNNPDSLTPSFTDNQVFRIVVIPAEFANDTAVDLNNIDSVMSALKIQESDIEKSALN